MFQKRGLHWMQLTVFRQAFNRRDLIALVHDGEGQT
jgi:hypothetical protein